MIFSITLGVIAVSFLLLVNYAVLALVYRRGKPVDTGPLGRFPKVSILKPISNIDDEMEANIDTFYALDYPDYEVLFALNNCSEECGRFIRRVAEKHPETVTRVIAVEAGEAVNPKITALKGVAPHAAGELYWVTDSNVRVEPDTLKRLVREYLTNDAKIVFSPIRGTGSRTFGSIVENSYIDGFVSMNIIGAWTWFRQQIIVGKSMLIEKAALDRLGGFARFGEYLAEDFMMGEIYTRNGIRISTNFTWVTNHVSTATLKKFWQRVERWSKLRYSIRKGFYIAEIIVNPVMLALVSLLFTGERGLPVLLAALAGKILLEYVNFFALNTGDRKKPWVIVLMPIAVVVKDVLLFFICFTPLFSNRVLWRGRWIRITGESRILNDTRGA